MTPPLEGKITYASFCGAMLDDMLDRVIHDIISKSLLNEKLIRKEYGTIKAPIFHDTPGFTLQTNGTTNGSSSNNNSNKIDLTGTDNEDEGEDNDDDSNKTDNDKDKTNNHSNINKQNKKLSMKKEGRKFTEPDIGRFQLSLNGKDLYVNALNDNKKLLGTKANAIVIGSAQDTYFECSNCGRNIAGSRFSGHIDKCFGGRSRK